MIWSKINEFWSNFSFFRFEILWNFEDWKLVFSQPKCSNPTQHTWQQAGHICSKKRFLAGKLETEGKFLTTELKKTFLLQFLAFLNKQPIKHASPLTDNPFFFRLWETKETYFLFCKIALRMKKPFLCFAGHRTNQSSSLFLVTIALFDLSCSQLTQLNVFEEACCFTGMYSSLLASKHSRERVGRWQCWFLLAT